MTFLPAFLLGFIATSFQILLLREFEAQFFGNELTFGLVLASWLLWGGLGSIAASHVKPSPEKLFRVYVLVIGVFPLSLLALRFSRFGLGILPGELIGLGPVLTIALVLCFLISFPLGVLFVLNVQRTQGRVGQVYIFESLGAAFAGLIVYFFFLPHFSHWQAASLVGVISLLLLAFAGDRRKGRFLLPLLAAALVAFSFFDLPSQKVYWKPFRLAEAKDTRYGRLQVTKAQEQTSLYSNGLHLYSSPDLPSAEESVHFALLQNPEAKTVLLIGGEAGGCLGEVLKYPYVEVDSVELDPEIIRLSNRFLPPQEKRFLAHERVHLFFQDGRAFLQKAKKPYEVIILNLPEPATAQVNRFYTLEFFRLAKSKLASGGLISFAISGAENYIGAELQQLLSSLTATLSAVFPCVRIVPGDRNIFIASSRQLTIDPAELSRRIEAYHLRNVYIVPAYLQARLHPLRIGYLEDKIKEQPGKINSDLAPIGFYFYSVLWSTHFRGWESRIIKAFSGLPLFWLLDFPLLVFVILLFFFWKGKKKGSFFLTPLALMGFTTIATEIILLVWFQALYGYLYGRIAVLFSIFMLGLFLGSWLGAHRGKASFPRLVLIQFGFLFFLFILQLMIKTRPPEIFPFAFLLALGYLGGELFIIANELYLREKVDYGLGYGLDLGGSFLGALATSSLLIPLAGLPLLARYLFLMNSFCLLFLVARPKNA